MKKLVHLNLRPAEKAPDGPDGSAVQVGKGDWGVQVLEYDGSTSQKPILGIVLGT